MGVAGFETRASANYETTELDANKLPLGSCDDP